MMKLIERIKILIKGKREVPQVGVNGISQDYINVVYGFYNFVMAHKHDGLDWFDRIKKIKHYEERFPLWQYKNVIDEKNKYIVNQLNQTIDEVNNLLRNKSRDDDRYLSLIKEVERLIYKEGVK